MYSLLGDPQQQIVQVVTSDAAGQAKQKQLDGIQLLLHALKDPRGTEISRVCACALLGQLALLTETEIVPEEVASSKCKLSPEELKVRLNSMLPLNVMVCWTRGIRLGDLFCFVWNAQ